MRTLNPVLGKEAALLFEGNSSLLGSSQAWTDL
jgi:hypothetical protein